jgi:hypothetical protein
MPPHINPFPIHTLSPKNPNSITARLIDFNVTMPPLPSESTCHDPGFYQFLGKIFHFCIA